MFALVVFNGVNSCPYKKTVELLPSDDVDKLSSLRDMFFSVKVEKLGLPWAKKLPILVKFKKSFLGVVLLDSTGSITFGSIPRLKLFIS